jgi:hypothetical protein
MLPMRRAVAAARLLPQDGEGTPTASRQVMKARGPLRLLVEAAQPTNTDLHLAEPAGGRDRMPAAPKGVRAE